MVLLRSALGVMLLALTVLLAAPNAFAGEGEITFCNEFPHRVSIAIAYLQTDVNNHLTRGWLNVGTGKCYVFDTAIRVNTFYCRAESETYKDGKDKVKMNWGNETDFAGATAISRSMPPRRNIPARVWSSFPRDPYRRAPRSPAP